MKRVLIFTICIFTAMQSAFGWGAKGHDIVTSIAEANLNKKALKNISEILDGKSIVYYSSWMDNLQNSPEWKGGYDVTKTWHYANVDEWQTYDSMEKEPKGDVVTASDMLVSALKSGELTDSLEADYLKMLVHVIADLHCPMHAGRRTDLGGNKVTVYWFNKKTNLHSLWDTHLLESVRTWSYTEWRLQLDRCNKKEIKTLSQGTPREWFDETAAIADYIYNTTTPDTKLSYQYMYDNRDIVEMQLLHAGYRLAAILNDIYG